LYGSRSHIISCLKGQDQIPKVATQPDIWRIAVILEHIVNNTYIRILYHNATPILHVIYQRKDFDDKNLEKYFTKSRIIPIYTEVGPNFRS